MNKMLIAGGASVVLLLGACSADSKDFQKETEKFIEGDKVSEAANGIEFDDAQCDKPSSTDTGTTYTCTAVNPADSASYTFTVEITKKDAFEVKNIAPSEGATGADAGTDGSVPAETVPAETVLAS